MPRHPEKSSERPINSIEQSLTKSLMNVNTENTENDDTPVTSYQKPVNSVEPGLEETLMNVNTENTENNDRQDTKTNTQDYVNTENQVQSVTQNDSNNKQITEPEAITNLESKDSESSNT